MQREDIALELIVLLSPFNTTRATSLSGSSIITWSTTITRLNTHKLSQGKEAQLDLKVPGQQQAGIIGAIQGIASPYPPRPRAVVTGASCHAVKTREKADVSDQGIHQRGAS